jgi:hypothetical protein
MDLLTKDSLPETELIKVSTERPSVIKYRSGERKESFSGIATRDNIIYGVIPPDSTVTWRERLLIESEEKALHGLKNTKTRVSVPIEFVIENKNYHLVWFSSIEGATAIEPKFKHSPYSGGRITIPCSDKSCDILNANSSIDTTERNDIFFRHLIRELNEEMSILIDGTYIGLGDYIQHQISKIPEITITEKSPLDKTITDVKFKMSRPMIFSGPPSELLSLLKGDISEAITVVLQPKNTPYVPERRDGHKRYDDKKTGFGYDRRPERRPERRSGFDFDRRPERRSGFDFDRRPERRSEFDFDRRTDKVLDWSSLRK